MKPPAKTVMPKRARPRPTPPCAAIQRALLSLAATRAGFEGLIDALLAAETGDAMRLMASGDQHGLDSVSDRGSGPRRAMQAKRYGDTAKLSQTALLGEMARAHAAFPGIDCWVLATTKTLLGKEAQALTAHAEMLGWGFVALDWSELAQGYPALAVLCASHIQIAARYRSLNAVRGDLAALAAAAGFAGARTLLAQRLAAADSGFVAVQRIAQRRLTTVYSDPAAGRTLAGASAAFLATAPPVPRQVLRESGRTWWEGGDQLRLQLGQEGMGKTWSAVALATELAGLDGGPLPIIIPARHAAVAADGLAALVAALEALGRDEGLQLADATAFWRRKLQHWATAAPGDQPAIVVVVDGLDELDDWDWAGWLAPLLTQQWRPLVRLVLTCRTDDWEHRIRTPIEPLLATPLLPTPVDRFIPEERDTFLASRGIDPAEVSAEVLAAALHPRTAFHLTRLAGELGDLKRITREQLLLRDFENIYQLKGGRMGGAEFMTLVVDQACAAQQAALSQQVFTVSQGSLITAAAEIAGRDRSQMRSVLSTLIGTSWFERDRDRPTMLTFGDAALPDAVGFALADLVRSRSVADAVAELDRFLEPWGADDLVEKVLRTCATALLIDPAMSDELCREVLVRWLAKPFHGAGGQDFWRRLHIFRPALFLELCFGDGPGGTGWLQEWGIASLWEDQPAIRPTLEARLQDWFSVVPLQPLQDTADPRYDRLVNRDRYRQRRRLAALEKRAPRVWVDRIGVESATWPDGARRTAARVIGFLPRVSFIPAFVAWAENCAAAGRGAHARELAALLRYSCPDRAATLAGLRAEATRLSATGTDLGRAAAGVLLEATGDPEDAAMAQSVAPRAPTIYYRTFTTDPASGQIVFVATREQVPDHVVLSGLSQLAIDPAAELSAPVAAALERAAGALPSEKIPELFAMANGGLRALLRWQPERFFALYRAYLLPNPVAKAQPAQTGTAEYRRHAFGALPLLTADERERVAAAIEQLPGSAAGEGSGAVNALRLAQAPLAAQLALLLDQPIDRWPRDYKYLLNQPVGTEIADLIAATDFGRSRDEIWPRLVLASALMRRFQIMSGAHDPDWTAAFAHTDEEVRDEAAGIAHGSRVGAAAGALAAALGTPASVSAPLSFNISALLTQLPDDELQPWLDQLDPEVMMRVYQQRDGLRHMVRTPLLRWMEHKLLVARTSRAFGGGYTHFHDREDAYAAFAQHDHAEAVRLIQTAWSDPALRDNIVFEHGEGPAWPLLRALASSEPALISEIWRGSIDDGGNMWIGSIELFPADLPPGPPFDVLRGEALVRPHSDDRLFDAVIAIEANGHGDFLRCWIRGQLEADAPLDQARALTVAGFLDGGEQNVALWQEIERLPVPAGWLGRVRADARAWFERVETTRYWRARVGSANDEESAYRAFWLSGRTVDDRYRLYYRAEGLQVDSASWRAQWLDLFNGVHQSWRKEAVKSLSSSFVLDKRPNDIVHGT